MTPEVLISQLGFITERFGVGRKVLADLLRVPPAALDLLKAGVAPEPEQIKRIEAMLELAGYWRSLSERSLGRRAFEPTKKGQSVIEMLADVNLPIESAKAALREWADDHEARVGRLRRKAVAKREEMARRGNRPLPDHVIDQTLREFAKSSI